MSDKKNIRVDDPTFPSKSSRLAPPPVLTWLSLSSALCWATTVAVSPPPTITIAPFLAASTLASNNASEPFANAGISKTPGGLYTSKRDIETGRYNKHTRSRGSSLLQEQHRGIGRCFLVQNRAPTSYQGYLHRQWQSQSCLPREYEIANMKPNVIPGHPWRTCLQ